MLENDNDDFEVAEVPTPIKQGKTINKRINLVDSEDNDITNLKLCIAPVIEKLESVEANEFLDDYGKEVRNSAVQLLINACRQIDKLKEYSEKIQAKKDEEEKARIEQLRLEDEPFEVPTVIVTEEVGLGEKGADSIVSDTGEV